MQKIEPSTTCPINAETTTSTSPDGESFPLPKPEDYTQEWKRLQKLAKEQRLMGRQIVVVMGVGFVGAVMAGVIADSKDEESKDSKYFVIGMQRPSFRSFWKIPYLNRGQAPVEAEDPEVAPLIKRCVIDKKTLTATFTYDALSLADIVVVDVQCDYHKETLGNVRQGHADIAALEESLKVIGEKIQPHCLVLIETTVPPGTTEYVAYPILKKAFERRALTRSTTDTSESGILNSESGGLSGVAQRAKTEAGNLESAILNPAPPETRPTRRTRQTRQTDQQLLTSNWVFGYSPYKAEKFDSLFLQRLGQKLDCAKQLFLRFIDEFL